MRLTLDGMSAFEYWMSVLQTPSFSTSWGPAAAFTSLEGRECRELGQALLRTDGTPGSIDLLVNADSNRSHSSWVHCRCVSTSHTLPQGSIIQIGSGLYVVSPELCVLRLATQLPRLAFLHAFTSLLGIYSFSSLDRQDLLERKPILTKARMQQYLNDTEGIPGHRIAQRALPWVTERTASPRETTMALALRLPSKTGGHGLPEFEANCKVSLSEEAALLTTKSYVVADVAWPDDDIYLEYNSDKHHDNDEQLEFDFEKITAMQRDGRIVVPISTRQFNSYEAFASIVNGVRKHLGVRCRMTDEVVERRRSTHHKLLEIERSQRTSPSLINTARWKYLFPRIDSDSWAA